MLKNFQKHKNTILMIAVWISLFWADFSLAQEFSYYGENEFKGGVDTPTVMEIVNGIIVWSSIIIFSIGIIGFLISLVLFMLEKSKKENEKKRQKYKKYIFYFLHAIIWSSFIFILYRFASNMSCCDF